MSPLGRYSCIAQGASPGLVIGIHLLSPVGAALSRRKTNARVIVPLLRSSILLFICVSPGFHIGLCPYFTLGFAGVSPLQGSLSDWLCFPRVLYRALPLFHPGLCRSVALAGLFVGLAVFPQGFISGFALIPPWALQECRPCRALCRIGCVSPGFHIGLCPHSTLGFAGVSPLQGSLSDWLCFPRVSYRALPSFHSGLCKGVALAGLIVGLACMFLGV